MFGRFEISGCLFARFMGVFIAAMPIALRIDGPAKVMIPIKAVKISSHVRSFPGKLSKVSLISLNWTPIVVTCVAIPGWPLPSTIFISLSTSPSMRDMRPSIGQVSTQSPRLLVFTKAPNIYQVCQPRSLLLEFAGYVNKRHNLPFYLASDTLLAMKRKAYAVALFAATGFVLWLIFSGRLLMP